MPLQEACKRGAVSGMVLQQCMPMAVEVILQRQQDYGVEIGNHNRL